MLRTPMLRIQGIWVNLQRTSPRRRRRFWRYMGVAWLPVTGNASFDLPSVLARRPAARFQRAPHSPRMVWTGVNRPAPGINRLDPMD